MKNAIFAKIGAFVGGLLITAASWFIPVTSSPAQNVVQSQTPPASVPILTVGLAEQEGLATAKQVATFAAQNEKFGGTGIIPQTAAFFETYTIAAIGTGDTSFTMASDLTTAGIPLVNGYYSFVLEQGTSQQEIVEGNVSGTVVSNLIRGIDPQNPDATDSALIFSHSRAADVKITDYSFIGHVSNILQGSDTFPNILSYAAGIGSSSFSNSQQLISKAYVDSVAFAGSPNMSSSTKGIAQEATTSTIASGTTVGSTGADLALTQRTASTTCVANNVVEAGSSSALASNCLTGGNYSPNTITATTTITNSLTSSSSSFSGTSTFTGNVTIPSSTNLNKLVETIFTASGTYIVPAGVTKIDYYILGAGGGGGVGVEEGNGVECGAPGGGSGGAIYTTSTTVTPLQIMPVVVGVGGSATGTLSSFNNVTSTGGGLGGTSTSNGSTCTLYGAGGLPGTPNGATGTTANSAAGQPGGAPLYIGSAGTAGSWPTVGTNGIFGGGGGGGSCTTANCTASGNGGQGLVLIFAHY